MFPDEQINLTSFKVSKSNQTFQNQTFQNQTFKVESEDQKGSSLLSFPFPESPNPSEHHIFHFVKHKKHIQKEADLFHNQIHKFGNSESSI